jgi:hypothetical protein
MPIHDPVAQECAALGPDATGPTPTDILPSRFVLSQVAHIPVCKAETFHAFRHIVIGGGITQQAVWVRLSVTLAGLSPIVTKIGRDSSIFRVIR